MSINKFNVEGYYDPTPTRLCPILKKKKTGFRPLVYIASPFLEM